MNSQTVGLMNGSGEVTGTFGFTIKTVASEPPLTYVRIEKGEASNSHGLSEIQRRYILCLKNDTNRPDRVDALTGFRKALSDCHSRFLYLL